MLLRSFSYTVIAIYAALLVSDCCNAAVINSTMTPIASTKSSDTKVMTSDRVTHEPSKHVWYYGSAGVINWKKMYHTCEMRSQSPININTDRLQYLPKLGDIDIFNYDMKPNKLIMLNNGHTVQVNVDGTQFIDQGGLPTTYHLKQFHFHWGSKNNVGSEHTIDGKQYPMEMHLVHWAVREGSIGDAMTKHEGLAVLGFMFTISLSDNPVLEPIIEGLQHVAYKGMKIKITEFAIASILPTNLQHYYRYMGSLTTPPCYQSVVWTVFKIPIMISQTQLNKFRSVYSNIQQDLVRKELVDNYRPVQPLNERIVWTSIPQEGGGYQTTSKPSSRGAVTCVTTVSFTLPTLVILLSHFSHFIF